MGIHVERLQLGGVTSMVLTPAAEHRQVDVLFMGGIDDHRGAALAGDLLEEFRSHRR